MKSPFSLAFATSALLLALYMFPSTSALPHNMKIEARSPETCGDPSDSVPFYVMELPNSNFFYSASFNDVTTVINGYDYMFEAARVFVTQELSTVPFFRLTANTTERDTVVAASDYIYIGVAPYIYPSQICGSLPFYRLLESSVPRRFYTTSLEDRDDRIATGVWSDQGIAGYVLDANACTSEYWGVETRMKIDDSWIDF
ncbi:hypothetical protein B0H16DRAFT_1699352 [Mycena metata]|uniref:DUF5648 domain-containing protein n=1 Tax=Mycena metata TaxID=1033252 RepID=A0AAD7HKH1_9AGAR|nr:hypothetical protein B0H16DRAFT_1699352 [Mycena metata]